MSFASRGFFGSQLFPTDASKFYVDAFTQGGVLNTTQKRAIAYLVNNLADLGIGAPGSNFLIYPFVGTSAINNALNLFSASTTAYNLTFVGSPTHAAAGTTFNGTTQYATGLSLAITDLGLTTANISFGFCTSGMGTGTYIPMGFAMNAALQTKTYSTAGSYTFNPNVEAPGITSFTITAYGGGGAGGGTNGTTSNFPAGGGAGGGYASRAVTLTKAQGATSMNITVGVGGTANTGAAGGNGGDSIVTHPNFTGINGNGGTGGKVNTAAAGASTAAPTANSGTTVFNGGTGAAGGALAGRGGGGGGSSAGTAANGNPGSTPTTTSGGAGGTAPTGGVAGGTGGQGVAGGAGFAGSPGTAGGGAGGGAGSTNTGNNRAGGGGGAGKVTISWTPATQKRNSMSIFNSSSSNNHLLNCDVGGDSTSRYAYQSTPNNVQGVRVGSRRGNTGTAADMGFYVLNNAGTAINGPAVMSTTSFDPSPQWYLGAINSWASTNGVGNSAGNLYSGTLNFAFIGPALSNGQLQAMYNLITNYNTILGR